MSVWFLCLWFLCVCDFYVCVISMSVWFLCLWFLCVCPSCVCSCPVCFLFVSVCCVYILSGLLPLWDFFLTVYIRHVCLFHVNIIHVGIFASASLASAICSHPFTSPFCVVLSGLLTSVLSACALAIFRALCLYFLHLRLPLSAFFTLSFSLAVLRYCHT